MSGCKPFGPEISAYRDGELARESHDAFDAHLPACDACRAALEALARLDARLAELPAVPPSGDFEARFWARLAREREPERLWKKLWNFVRSEPWLPAVAATGVAVAALVWLNLGSSVPAPLDPDLALVADAEFFDLVLAEDPDLLATLDLLEAWDGSEEI